MIFRFLLLILASGFVLAACGKADRSVRHYQEVSMVADDAKIPDAPMMSDAPFAGSGAMKDLPPGMQSPAIPLEWETPEGWEQRPGSGMRVATFMVQGQECSILTFPGDVGGDEANIRRWLGQIGETVSDDKLKAFVENPARFTTSGGFECRFFDYENLIPAGSPRNIIAGIIPLGEHTAFIKLMGDAKILKEQKPALEALCKSIRLKPESI